MLSFSSVPLGFCKPPLMRRILRFAPLSNRVNRNRRYNSFKRMRLLANGFPPVTSTSMVKTAVAFMMSLMLLSIVAVCPLMACSISAGSDGGGNSCCHKSQPPPTSCPRTTVRDCPYFVLESGKIPNGASPIFTLILHHTSAAIGVPSHFAILPTDSRLPSSAGLFLRIRVLRV